MGAQTFTERLAMRRRLWWDPPWPGRGRTLGDAAHRLRERRAFHSRDQPDQDWRCCEYWPRTLLNKWNAREFAAKQGCPLPALYWSGSDYSEAPVESLPSEFVIRPMFGTYRKGVAVVVGGRELLSGGSVSGDGPRGWLPRSGRLRRRVPILIEEFVRAAERDALPMECKCHTFGPHVAAVEMVERRSAHTAKTRWYTPAWEPIPDRMQTFLPLDDEVRDPPHCVERVLSLAAKIGGEVGTYMRIDFFVAEGGCVFNEFSSLPLRGGHNTPYGDAMLGAVWAERCPDAT